MVVLGTLLGGGLVGAARAADISIAGRKLVIVDKLNATGRAKVVFVATHPGVTKGSGTNQAQISVQLDLSYDSASGAFLGPQGSGWLTNKDTIAKYVNREAPTGGATRIALVRPGKLLKLVAPSLGDTPIDVSSAPSGSVLAVYSVTNGAEVNRHCTSFPVCAHKSIAAGTGYKLVCKVGDVAACPGPPTTTSIPTTTSTSSTTTTSTSSTTSTTAPVLTGPSFPPDGGTVSFAFSGSPSAGDSGGRTIEFTSFVPDTTWIELYWGPSSAALPTAGLDGVTHSLTFSGIGGTTATWAGTTSWTNPVDSVTHNGVPIEVRVTVTGLGATPWVASTSISGLDPGPGTGIGAVVDNSASFLDFDANVQFLADIPTDGSGNFIALNTVQVSGSQANSSFTGGFYSKVP
jgi:hypothetical protein